ncbi:MAG: phosphoribosylanthranilate isomerase [Spirochaetes bacterium]|nr:phosphoribosylanthranilate isomerase [Spirochaetota bacterium]
MVRVKICGITCLPDALMCLKAGADALGFVFYKKSKRYISPVKAKTISKKMLPFTYRVGLFVNEKPETIIQIARLVSLEAIQLHGDETPSVCERLSQYYTVIKAFPVSESGDVKKIFLYKNTTFLFDTRTPGFGGSGKSFPWDILIPFRKKLGDFILSGGLDLQNITQAIDKLNPYAVDVSSGVERSPGKKDKNKVEQFIKKAKGLL